LDCGKAAIEFSERQLMCIIPALNRFLITILNPAGARKESENPVSDYDLKIDAQVEKFLENKHKLVYFLVTASAAPIVLVVQFAYGKSLAAPIIALAVGGIATGLAAAGSSLHALQFELASYRNHIEYRYAKKTWTDLTSEEKERWERTNKRATKYIRIAFLLMYLEFALMGAVGIALLLSKPEPSPHRISVDISSKNRRNGVHHFGENMTRGWIEDGHFIIEARHHTTGALVTMRGPTAGVFENSQQVVDGPFVQKLAQEFAHFLRENLNPDSRQAGASQAGAS
jgi:hypothetical protein